MRKSLNLLIAEAIMDDAIQETEERDEGVDLYQHFTRALVANDYRDAVRGAGLPGETDLWECVMFTAEGRGHAASALAARLGFDTLADIAKLLKLGARGDDGVSPPVDAELGIPDGYLE